MRNLTQLMKRNGITDEQMYAKYKTFKTFNIDHDYGTSLKLAFTNAEQFILAALGLNYLEDAITQYVEDPRQRRLFDDNSSLN